MQEFVFMLICVHNDSKLNKQIFLNLSVLINSVLED